MMNGMDRALGLGRKLGCFRRLWVLLALLCGLQFLPVQAVQWAQASRLGHACDLGDDDESSDTTDTGREEAVGLRAPGFLVAEQSFGGLHKRPSASIWSWAFFVPVLSESHVRPPIRFPTRTTRLLL